MSFVLTLFLSRTHPVVLAGGPAARSALTSLSSSMMRYPTGSSARANSASVKRGVMCCGQFQSKALSWSNTARSIFPL